MSVVPSGGHEDHRAAGDDDSGRAAPPEFPLLRYFVVTSFLVTLVITVAMAVVWVQRADHDFSERTTARGLVEAARISEMFYHSVWSPGQDRAADSVLADVADPDTMTSFKNSTVMGLDVTTFSLLEADGSLLWSSHTDVRGGYPPDDELSPPSRSREPQPAYFGDKTLLWTLPATSVTWI